jgi:hypothetical protein
LGLRAALVGVQREWRGLTQIPRFLALTPLERLVGAEQAAAEIEALRSIARVKISAHGKR